MIAALGGAEKVLVLTRDSRYGHAATILQELRELAGAWSVDHRIAPLSGRADARIAEADVVTNLGFVRPIDKDMIDKLKSTVAIPLMWETWGYREADLDLQYCRAEGIPVLGTDESHPFLRTLDYIGACAAKALFAAGIEVFGSRLVILGGGAFAKSCITMMNAMGSVVSHVDVNAHDDFVDELAVASRGADAIIVVEHHARRQLIGDSGGLSPERVGGGREAPLIIHICGNVDSSRFQALGLHVYPLSPAPAGYMSLATDFVGPKPLIDLHTAGLAIGACLARKRLQGNTAHQAEEQTLKNLPFAQSFASNVRNAKTDNSGLKADSY